MGDSPMIITTSWLDAFRTLDQWDVVEKLRDLHLKSNAGGGPSGLIRFCSPDIAHLVANTRGGIRLFHHFHHDANTGLNEGTNALWALQGGGELAAAMTLDTTKIEDKQIGTPFDWSDMIKWRSTQDVVRTIEILTGTNTDVSDRAGRPKTKPTPSKAGTKKKGRKPKGKSKAVLEPDEPEPDEDNEDDIEVVGYSMASILPVPAFIATKFMESYETDLVKLCFMSFEAICERGLLEPDQDKALRLAEAAAYVPRWILSIIINSKRTDGTVTQGIGSTAAYSKRSDDWARGRHLKHLAVKARSVITPSERIDVDGYHGAALRNLSDALERQTAHAIAHSPPPTRTGFDAFPQSTKNMILFVSERGEDGRARDTPQKSFRDILSLGNVAFIQTHIHDFLRNTKGKDALIPTGLGAAIKTAAFIADTPDRPGAFSLFCCGPQTLYSSGAAARDNSDYANTNVQMQLKTTDTTTGFSEKDIKTMTKLNFTAPRDFYELARLLENMAGITELLFGARSPLTEMLEDWHGFLTGAAGTTLATLRQLAHDDSTAACRLGWFIDRRMQQYLVGCACARNEDDVNASLLHFGPTRQQLEDGAFTYPLCEFLMAKTGRGKEPRYESNTNASSTTLGQRPPKRNAPADAVLNPQGDLFTKEPHDVWQVFIDQVRSSPVPNMCCRWHLNGKCVRSCFNVASHVALTADQTSKVRAWVEQCRARMRRPAADQGPSKKTKLGPNEPPYSRPTFVAAPSKWSTAVDPQHALFHERRNAARLRERTPRTPSPGRTNTGLSPTKLSSPVSRPFTRPRPHTPSTPKTRNAASSDSPATDRATTSPRQIDTTDCAEGDRHDRDPHRVLASQTHPPLRPHAQIRPSPNPESKSTTATVPFPTIPLPHTEFVLPRLPEPRLAEALARILSAKQPLTHTPEFRFEWSTEAAAHNLDTFERYEFDLERALQNQPFCALTPGSEFRSAHDLAPLLSMHPLWPRFLERITEGAEFPLRAISDKDRMDDVAANLARGNHKSARGHEAKLISMLKDEVTRGWQLPLPPESVGRIKGCEVAPLGMVVQKSIDEKGEPIDKYRLTHDQTFSPSGAGGRSVNDRVDDTALTPARFGKAFSRLIYHINFLRQWHSDKRILLTKVDCKSAYRRIHLKPTTAVKSCTSVDGLLLVALRMTFGGSPNPSQWSDVSEVVTDLANDLIRRNDWDHDAIHSPHQHLLTTAEAVDNDKGVIDRNSPFVESEFFAVHYPDEDDLPRFDCYLDDIFGAFCEEDEAKSAAAIPLALHIVARPVTDEKESFPRDDILAKSKFLAEARPSECKTILGWFINTRAFTVALPHDKCLAWTRSIDNILLNHKRKIRTADLESIIGRLSNAAFVIPFARHFTGRLYKACSRSRTSGAARLTSPQLEDLVLWKRFLAKAREGVSINHLVCRWPTRIIRVDACPQGIGGYCLESGIAWRYLLPEDLIGRATLNLLEFLAAFVGLIVEYETGNRPTTRDVFLSQGDSTSAAGWLAKSSFDDNCPMHLAMARDFAGFCINKDICHYTQWFPGRANKVADILSRDFALNDEKVTKLIRDNCSPFVPQNFRIIHLPPMLISRIGDLLRLRPKTLLLPNQPAPSEIAAGGGTKCSSDASDTSMTLFSKSSDEDIESKPSPASRPPCGTEGFVLDAVRELAMEQCPTPFVPPSTAWLRPFGLTNLRAPSTTQPDESNPS